MRIALTGGTGMVGSHLARSLLDDGHDVVVVSRSADAADIDERSGSVDCAATSITDEAALEDAFADCEAVAHLAGINREIGEQTYEAVHVRGTEAVVAACEATGVDRIALASFLRARTNCGSGYHESKWASEEIVRNADLDATVLKPGVVYGEGDQMVTHLARSLATIPLFPSIGFGETRLRPLAVEDLVRVFEASLVDGRLTDQTVAVLGPEELTLDDAVRRIGAVIGRNPRIVPAPVRLHYLQAAIQERVMEVPIIGTAQVRMLAEGIVEAAPADVCGELPEDLQPEQRFTEARIDQVLTDVSRFGVGDLRW